MCTTVLLLDGTYFVVKSGNVINLYATFLLESIYVYDSSSKYNITVSGFLLYVLGLCPTFSYYSEYCQYVYIQQTSSDVS